MPTLASAMDVGHPSNLERLIWLYGGDLARMRAAITGVVVTDDEVRDDDSRAARRSTATSPTRTRRWAGSAPDQAARGDGAPTIVLATAHPAKFPEVVEPTLGQAVALPPALAARLALDVRAVRIPPRLDALTARAGGHALTARLTRLAAAHTSKPTTCRPASPARSLLGVLAALVVAFFGFDLDRFASLERAQGAAGRGRDLSSGASLADGGPVLRRLRAGGRGVAARRGRDDAGGRRALRRGHRHAARVVRLVDRRDAGVSLVAVRAARLRCSGASASASRR